MSELYVFVLCLRVGYVLYELFFFIDNAMRAALLRKPEVFNLCHAVDPTEIPSSDGGPHGPRHTGFNLSYSWLGQNMSY